MIAARWASLVWRLPLGTAVALLLLAGPAQSWGLTGAVSALCLTAVALAGIAVPLGMLALRAPEPRQPPHLSPDLEALR